MLEMDAMMAAAESLEVYRAVHWVVEVKAVVKVSSTPAPFPFASPLTVLSLSMG